MSIDKTFDPAAIEARWYRHWEETGLFRPARDSAEPFTIVMPPPNVTGSLHIGHALDVTLQDILVRHARLRGKDALWVVGTDHAGIATQMVVERNLAREGVRRTDLSRDDFIAKVWDWKAESGGQITRQLRRLGASCDWAGERFTMDEGFSRAVTRVFVELHRRGLLYRDKRLVNWDPHFRTAISDLEVETREVQGSFWHLRYPLADGSGTIPVATTRPETVLADMAVAVHPDDDRYRSLVGRQVRLPITGRLVPIVADEHADPALGSGAVKITPGHDFNDFDVGVRAGIEPAAMLTMLDAGAQVAQTADGLVPSDLLGLDRFEARLLVVKMLEAEGALEREEARIIPQPTGDRSGVVIEPFLTDQWYVDAETLAGPALDAVRSGAIRIVPESWKKTWFHWLENIQPWCVSRQLWWGHQIPAWYADDGRIFVAETQAEAEAQAGPGVALARDPDVLDTWFSSALWPFGTLGWPAATETLRRHYPNDVLISGFDILFFWDARMAMQGLQFMGERPWKTLYLHGLVRDAQGRKMSKSKGNTVDPLGLIDRFGADALRFTLAAMESQGRDIRLAEGRVEGYRNFATKLWNAARFAQGYGIGGSSTLEPPDASLAVNRWIIHQTQGAIQALDLALADFRFDEAANVAYHFVWDRFCDWYLELIKPMPGGDVRGEIEPETKAVAGWVLDQILAMLHPFMPFITEELWHALAERDHDLIVGRWPMADARATDPAAVAEVDWLIRLVGEIRTARSELNVPPSARLVLIAGDTSPETEARLDVHYPVIARLARLDSIVLAPPPPGGAAQVVVDEATYALPLEGVIDLAAERTRLGKALATAEKERDALDRRLGTPAFTEKARPEAVAKAQEDRRGKAAEAERLRAALARLA